MIRAALCGLLLLAGCDAFDPPAPVLERKASIITIKIDPDLPTLGLATWTGDLCTITLREYPYCLQHEARHCFEGDWHTGFDTATDCY